MSLPKLTLLLVCMIVLMDKQVFGKDLGTLHSQTNEAGAVIKARVINTLSELVKLWGKLVAQVYSLDGGANCAVTDLVAGVTDDKITASSVYQKGFEPHRARLNIVENLPRSGMYGSWLAKTGDNNKYIQVDLGIPRHIYSVTTKGRSGNNQYVKEYFVSYSLDGKNWLGGTSFTTFSGNSDNETPVVNKLPTPVIARYFRIHPTSWNSHPSMRFGVNGC